jgi:hypothetical protein
LIQEYADGGLNERNSQMFNFNSHSTFKAKVRGKFRLVIALSVGLMMVATMQAPAQAGQIIYSFSSPATVNSSSSIPVYPTALGLAVEQDLDTLDLTLGFQAAIPFTLFDSTAPIQPGTTGTASAVISIIANNGRGIVAGSNSSVLNIGIPAKGFAYNTPISANVGLSNNLFSTNSYGNLPTNCPVSITVSSVYKQTLSASFSRNCLGLATSFSIQSQYIFTSNNSTYPMTTPYTPFQVDLTQVAGIKMSQSIQANSIQDVYLGQGSVQFSASDSAGLPMTYAATGSSGICSIPNSTSAYVHLDGPGRCTISIVAPGNTQYSNATSVQLSFQVLTPQLDQTIDQDFPPSISLDNPQIDFNVSSSSGVPVAVTSTTTNICQVINSQTVQANNPGTCQLTLSAPTSGNYKPAQQQISIPVTPAHIDQNISYYAPENVHVGGSGFDIDLRNDARLPLQLTSDSPNVCTFNKSSDPLYVTIVGAGTCSFEVNQDGNDQYSPFSATGVTFLVLPAIANNPGSISSAPQKVQIKASTSTAGSTTKISTQSNTTGIASSKTTATTGPSTPGMKVSAKSTPPTTKIKITTKAATKPAPKPSPSKGKK